MRRTYLLALCGALLAAEARADPQALDARSSVIHQGEPKTTSEARAAFVRANELARDLRWAEALAEFERASLLRPHATTSYNVALCQRALGRYTRARLSLVAALERGHTWPDELPQALESEVGDSLREIDSLLARIVLRTSGEASVTVDGAPLLAGQLGAQEVSYAGARPLGAGEAVAETTAIVLDPGVHLLVLTRPGHRDVLLRRELGPGEQIELPVDFEQIPGTIVVRANRRDAAVAVDDLDVGLAPVTVARPPGSYTVSVRHPRYLDHRSRVELGAGESLELPVTLQLRPPPVYRRWWFWTTTAAITVGGAALGWGMAAARKQEPKPNGGSLQWIVTVP